VNIHSTHKLSSASCLLLLKDVSRGDFIGSDLHRVLDRTQASTA